MMRIFIDTGFTEFIGRDQIRIALVCGYDCWKGLLRGMQKVLGEAPDGLEIAREQNREGRALKALAGMASLFEGVHLRPSSTHDTPTATPVIPSEPTFFNLILLAENSASRRSTTSCSPR